jgi:uncharacterized lipoprotein YajG
LINKLSNKENIQMYKKIMLTVTAITFAAGCSLFAPASAPAAAPTPVAKAAVSTPVAKASVSAPVRSVDVKKSDVKAEVDCDKVVNSLNDGKSARFVAKDMKISSESIRDCRKHSHPVLKANPKVIKKDKPNSVESK